MPRSDSRVGKVKRASRVCDNCRRRKVKCIGSIPCRNCVASGLTCDDQQHSNNPSEQFFRSPIKLTHDVSSLKDSLVGFLDQMSTADSQKLKDSLTNAISALGDINLESYSQMRYEALEKYNSSKSIESEMVGKRNMLNRFEPDTSSANDLPVNSYFGLYSPLVYFSTVGITYMMKRLLRLRDDRAIRETLYILLKFLDVSSMSHLNLGLSTTEKPEQNVDILVEIKDVLSKMPPNVYEKLADFNTAHPNTADERLSLCIDLFQKLQETFAEPPSHAGLLSTYFEATEIVSSLCRENYRLSVFAMIDVLSPENLIKMVEQTYWTFSAVSMGKIIAQICRRLLDGGFNRWEYNLGLQEERADRNRKLWWKCYWWDRWYAINTGKPPLLPDEESNCLFPLDVLQLRVNDEMDCLTLAREVDLQQSDLESCLQFGYILLAKTISFAFSAVLYNREFTAYKLHSGDCRKKSSVVLAKLKRYNDLLHETFHLIDDKLIPILLAAFKESRCFELLVHCKMTMAFILQALCGLFNRLDKSFIGKQISLLHSLTERNEVKLFEVSRIGLLNILQQNNMMLFIRITAAVPIFMLNLASHMISKRQEDAKSIESFVLNLSIMYAVCERYDGMFDVSRTESFGTNYLEFYMPLAASSCFIFTRMGTQAYMGIHKRTNDQFLQDLESTTNQHTEIARKILDVRSPLFTGLLKSHQQSAFTKCILNHSRMKMEDLKMVVEVGQDPLEKLNNAAENGNESMSAVWPINDSELDLFISSDHQLNLLDIFWDEATSLHFDYNNQ